MHRCVYTINTESKQKIMNLRSLILLGCLVFLQCRLFNEHIDIQKLESIELSEIDAILADNAANSAYLYEKGNRLFNVAPAEAVYYLHKSVRNAPQNAFYREQLANSEELLGITQQLTIPWYISSDIFFLVICSMWLLFWGFFITRQFLRLAFLRIGMICCIVMFCVGLGGLLWMHSLENAEFDVVFKNNTRITVIPDTAAQNWIVVPTGTALYRHEQHGNFVRVSNGKIIDGWVEESALLRGAP